MAKFPRVGHHYQDGLGNVVRVISTCAALIVFNARFRRLA